VDKDVTRRSPSRDDLERVKEAGFSFLDNLTQLEENLFAKGFHVKEGSPMRLSDVLHGQIQETL